MYKKNSTYVLFFFIFENNSCMIGQQMIAQGSGVMVIVLNGR